MKRRHGFVSNSSSSSFVIGLSKLTADQVFKIERHIETANLDNFDEIEWKTIDCKWSIEVTEDFVRGDTWMDNFDMHAFLKRIGVNMDDVRWDH
jgi:hypothetical protein